ncbi:MAG: hypothetical protein DMF18_09715 [Verrucomicrobia bacterium]|nr:MAG: hypothetical protein DMF18_09715 [Verrucomicrobiota bacterium]
MTRYRWKIKSSIKQKRKMSGGEGGITRPASAARMLPAFERCLHALLWRQGQSNEFESPVHEDAECCETAEYN